MEKNVKAVIDLMETLEVSLEDVAKELGMTVCTRGSDELKSAEPPKDVLRYERISRGFTSVIYNGEIIGLLISGSSAGTFILARCDYARNMDFYHTKCRLEREKPVAGRRWEVPEDRHFNALEVMGIKSINSALREIKGDEIKQHTYLSATSQANQPSSWIVRLIIPL